MNKGELIEAVASELEESRTEATRAVDAVLRCITKGVMSDKRVSITGFGSFELKHRAERRGVNPATREPLTIPAANTVSFKPGAALKESVSEAVVA